MMRLSLKLHYLVFLTSGAAGLIHGQSVIVTVLGGSPNGLAALSATMQSPSAVGSDLNGNVFVALRSTGQVLRIDSGGTVHLYATVGFFSGFALDSTGTVYTIVSNRVERVNPNGTVSVIAGTGSAGHTGDGGPATQATLRNPTGIAFDRAGNLFIADTGNHAIREVTLDGNITTIAGLGYESSGGDNGPALQAGLNSPSGVAVDSADNVYIADTGNNEIRVVSPGGIIERYAGQNSTSAGFPLGGGNPNLALNATLASPTVIALDSSGNLYMLESSSNRIRRITPDGKIGPYAGTGTKGGSGDGGWAWAANLNGPLGIAVDSKNDLLIADTGNNRVRIVAPPTAPSIGSLPGDIINTLAGDGLSTYSPRALTLKGTTLYYSDGASNRVGWVDLNTGQTGLLAGDGTAAFGGDGGDATSASLNGPRGLATDSSGNVYIADSLNNRIRKVTTSGTISTVAGNGTASTTGDNGAATSGTLDEPYAVAIDQSGNLYIAERSGHVVRKVTTTGTITTVAGTGLAGAPSSETGQAVNQSLNYPQGLAIEPAGTLLIADTQNNRIRRLSGDGSIATVAGSGKRGLSGDGGPATSATLSFPLGVGEDSNGNIYIADTSNSVVRWVGTDGIIGTIAGTGKPGYNGDGRPATGYPLNSPNAVVPGSGCSALIADTQNQRIRQLSPAVNYVINSNPAGLQVIADGQTAVTPFTIQLLPGSSYPVNAPSPQNGTTGTRYLSPGSQSVNVSCGPAYAAFTLNFLVQYSLTVTASEGGSVSSAAVWQDSGAAVTLVATPNSGYVFTGWQGDCSGQGSCQLTMNGPKTVTADFALAKPAGGDITREPRPSRHESSR